MKKIYVSGIFMLVLWTAPSLAQAQSDANDSSSECLKKIPQMVGLSSLDMV